jgi:hypothetical protein
MVKKKKLSLPNRSGGKKNCVISSGDQLNIHYVKNFDDCGFEECRKLDF